MTKAKFSALFQSKFANKISLDIDLGAIDAGLEDLAEEVDEIRASLIPAMARLAPEQYDLWLDQLVDLQVRFQHIGAHLEDAKEALHELIMDLQEQEKRQFTPSA